MLEDGEIDEEVASSQPNGGAYSESNKHKSPSKAFKSTSYSGANGESMSKRSKLSADDSYHHGVDHSSYHNHNGSNGGYSDWDDRIVAAVPRSNGGGGSGAPTTANSLMSIPMSSLKLVSKTLKDQEPAESHSHGSSSSGWLSPPKRESGDTPSGRAGLPPSIFDLITSSTLGGAGGLQHPAAAASSSDKLANFLNFDSNQMQQSTSKSVFVDPIITEKENKPKARNQNTGGGHQQPGGGGGGQDSSLKRKYGKGGPSSSSSTSSSGPTFEISDKKAEKKRKYFDDHHKKESKPFVPREREPIVCKFYLEGRCQKGDECPFSHNVQLNKRLEICKYYLNGFCAKKDHCLYMHSDFPCKFFHRVNRETGQRRSDCLHGSQCRFSHEPIKNPMLKEAFEKYLAECDELAAAAGGGGGGGSGKGKFNDQQHSSGGSSSSTSNIPSLMTLPVAAPAPSVSRPLGSPNAPSSPPPLQTPLPLLSTSIMSLDRMAKSAMPATATFQDVDERDVVVVAAAALKPPTALMASTGDIDERAIPASVVVAPSHLNNLTSTVATVKEPASSYNADKEKLMGLVMKAIADDGSVFSKIPKPALSELLLKLLQNRPSEGQLTHDTIKTLLTTFTSVAPTTTTTTAPVSSHTPAGDQGRKSAAAYNDYDDDDDEDDNDEGNLVIEGNVGEIPYKIYEIDVEPSSLWANPPNTSMASLLAASLGNEDAIDQESDPRIKYYANKANLANVANFQLQSHLQSQQQQQQQQALTPGSPSHASQSPSSNQTTSASNGSLADLVKQTAQAKAQAPAARLDPRLARSINQTANPAAASPTRSLSPTSNGADLSDAIHNLASSNNNNNLLASLPDFQLPKMDQLQRNNGSSSSFSSLLSSQASSTAGHSDTSTSVKLSIEDYKRKLQKPMTNGLTSLNPINSSAATVASSSSSTNNLSSLAASLNAPSQALPPSFSALSTSPTIPGMPSMNYSLQAPQSLHELLRNFQS